MNKITLYMTTKIDRHLFLSLIKEFCGEDAVDGENIYMDPEMKPRPFPNRLYMIRRCRVKPGVFSICSLKKKWKLSPWMNKLTQNYVQ